MTYSQYISYTSTDLKIREEEESHKPKDEKETSSTKL